LGDSPIEVGGEVGYHLARVNARAGMNEPAYDQKNSGFILGPSILSPTDIKTWCGRAASIFDRLS